MLLIEIKKPKQKKNNWNLRDIQERKKRSRNTMNVDEGNFIK